jgi:hypothetical protein
MVLSPTCLLVGRLQGVAWAGGPQFLEGAKLQIGTGGPGPQAFTKSATHYLEFGPPVCGIPDALVTGHGQSVPRALSLLCFFLPTCVICPTQKTSFAEDVGGPQVWTMPLPFYCFSLVASRVPGSSSTCDPTVPGDSSFLFFTHGQQRCFFCCPHTGRRRNALFSADHAAIFRFPQLLSGSNMLSVRALATLLVLATAVQLAHGYGDSVKCGENGIICIAKVKMPVE